MHTESASTWLTPRSRARLERTGAVDVVVVPGALVYPDGRPSPTLERRVRAAVWLVGAGHAEGLLVSGRGDGPRSEAEVGATLAVALGVDEDRVELEDASVRTAENARFVAPLVRGRRVAVVTDAWHAPRARLWFRRYLPDSLVLAIPSPTDRWLRFGPRELVKVTWQTFERWPRDEAVPPVG